MGQVKLNIKMMLRSSQKQKKHEYIFSRNQLQPTSKRSLLQSHQFTTQLRRHSVYPAQSKAEEQQPFTARVSSKQLKPAKSTKGTRKDNHPHSLEKVKIIRRLPEKDSRESGLSKKAFRYVNMVGKGGFGKVWKVEHLPTGRLLAMKEMSKAIVISKRSVESILNERQFLATLRHRFIVNMLYAFQDQQNLYIIMNLMEGGDLRYHLSKMTVFSQGETKFMIASILLALEYLHRRRVIHRDVKPQNIVFDRQGYAYLTDLGIAKHFRQDNNEDTSGTPGYMAPEVMFHHNHRYQVDFYALGVIMYELMMGKRPYLGKSRQQIKAKIKERQILIGRRQIPEGWSMESADFANKLLQRKPVERLGWAGIEQVKSHPWFANFPWSDMEQARLQSPASRFYNFAEVRYRPTQNDTNYNRLLNKNKQMLRRGTMQDYFEGYTYQDQTTTTAQNTVPYCG